MYHINTFSRTLMSQIKEMNMECDLQPNESKSYRGCRFKGPHIFRFRHEEEVSCGMFYSQKVKLDYRVIRQDQALRLFKIYLVHLHLSIFDEAKSSNETY